MDSTPLLLAAHQWYRQAGKSAAKAATAVLKRQGVAKVKVSPASTWASAEVTAAGTFEPFLEFDQKLKLWSLRSSCREPKPCRHGLSLCLALIESPALAVTVADPTPGSTPAPPRKRKPVLFREFVRSELGRPLAPSEANFLARVSQLYRDFSRGYGLMESHLWQLGWPGRIPSFSPLEGFDEGTKTEMEFWFGLVDLAHARGYTIPPFLQNLKAPEELAERIRDQKKARALAQWRHALSRLHATSPGTEDREIQLRFRWSDHRVTPEVRQGEETWRPLKKSQFETFRREDSACLRGTAAALWESFYWAAFQDNRQSDEMLNMQRWLNAQLRSAESVTSIVDAEGVPIRLHPDPLRWRLREPTQDDGAYALELVDSEGRPAGPVLAKLAGRPVLYQTAAGVFRGPPPLPPELSAESLAAIPAQVVESGLGMRLLEWAQIEPPASVRSKVQVVTLKAVLALKVDRTRTPAQCTATGMAAGPGGHHAHSLTGGGWTPAANSSSDDMVHVDSSEAREVVALLRQAGFSPEPYRPGWSLKLSRDYPELMRGVLDSLATCAKLRLCPELTSLREGQLAGSLRLEATEAGPDWFDLQVVVRVEDTSLTPDELKALVAARGKWLRLGNRWRRLDYQVSSEEETNLARIGLSPRQLGTEPQRLHASTLRPFRPTFCCRNRRPSWWNAARRNCGPGSVPKSRPRSGPNSGRISGTVFTSWPTWLRTGLGASWRMTWVWARPCRP